MYQSLEAEGLSPPRSAVAREAQAAIGVRAVCPPRGPQNWQPQGHWHPLQLASLGTPEMAFLRPASPGVPELGSHSGPPPTG